MRYAKAIVAIAGAGLAALNVALDDGIFSQQEWIAVVVAVLTAVGVYLVPNEPS